MKQIITKAEVAKAIGDLVTNGKKPTLAAVHALLNHRGSMSTLVRLKGEIDSESQPATDSAEGLKAFREVWALAFDEGRKQQDVVVAELREIVKALAIENERLEGALIAAQNHANELAQAKLNAESELAQIKNQIGRERQQAKTELAAATSQAAEALRKLAETQSANTAQVGALQSDLSTAVQRTHEIELQLVRAVALLESKNIHVASTAEPRKPKPTK